jgi:DNA-binding MarR family transcriptional regulator
MPARPDSPLPFAREAWRLMLIAQARMTAELESAAAATGTLPPTWFDVLVSLEASPHRRLRLGDLADAVLLTRAGLSRLLDRVEAAGYLRREACAEDGRGMFAAITDAGRAAVRAAWPTYFKHVDNRLGKVLGDDAEVFLGLLRRVAEANDWLPELRPVTLGLPGKKPKRP